MLERINWRRKPLSLLAFLNDAKFFIHLVHFFPLCTTFVLFIMNIQLSSSQCKFYWSLHWAFVVVIVPMYKSCLACMMPIWMANASFQRNIIFFTFHRQIGWISKKENMVAILHFSSACYGLSIVGIKHVYSCTLLFVLCDYLVVFFATFSFAHATHQTRTLLELTRLWTLLSQQ